MCVCVGGGGGVGGGVGGVGGGGGMRAGILSLKCSKSITANKYH